MNAQQGFREMRMAWTLVLGSAIAATAGEANYQPYIVGERAAGMGGAVVATADGMDASFYNPAGLGREKHNSISVNGTLYGIQRFETEDAAFPGEDLDISSFVTIPTGLSAVKKLKEGTAVSFSVFVPSQTSAREIKVFTERQHFYNFSQDEQTLMLGPSIGHALDDRLSIGASVFGLYTTANDFENLYWGDYSYTYTQNYKYSVLGVIGTLGVQYRFADEWSAGLTVTTPSGTLTGSGRVQLSEVQGDEQVSRAEAIYYDDLEADNGLPAQVRFGIGWRRPDVGSAGLDITHHLARNFAAMEGEQDDKPVIIRKERKAVTDVQVGGEFILRKRFPLRAGFFTSFSSAPDLDVEKTSMPSQIDLYGLTTSIGAVGENVVLNFGLSYVWGEGDAFGSRIDDESNLLTGIATTRESCLYAFASTTYRF